MSKWSGSDFVGPTEQGWPQGVGKFRFPNGVVYEGNFDKGEFHGDGTLHYPNGVSNFKLNLTLCNVLGPLRGEMGSWKANFR